MSSARPATVPNIRGVAEVHRHGDVLQHAWFPQVYPRHNERRA